MTAGPIAFAHRGARAYAPENTIAAFQLALAQGADGLETDAWLAADSVPVLVHDASIRRPGRRIPVTRRTSVALAELDVPTLADLYHACGTDFELSIDVQHEAVAEPLLLVADAFRAIERLWLCSGDLALLARLSQRSERPHLVCSTGLRRPGGLAGLVPKLRDSGVEVVNLHWSDWTQQRVGLVHDAGLLAFGWDAQTDDAVDALLRLDIDGVYGDRPDRLVERVRGRGSGVTPPD